MDLPRMPRKFLPRFIRNENEEELEIRCQLAVEKFKSEVNLQKKRSEKYQERFMKIDVEMITYLTGHFENTEVCDGLIKEWETDCTKEEEKSIQIFDKKEDFFLNNSSSGYQNKPNRDESTERKRVSLKNGKETRHQIEAIIHESEAEVKLEIVTDEIKVKALEIRNNQHRIKRSKTQDNREKYDQKKRKIFAKGRTTSENFETIVITTNRNN